MSKGNPSGFNRLTLAVPYNPYIDFIMTVMTKSTSSLLFLGKADDPDCARALEYCQKHFSHVTYCLGKWGDPLPEEHPQMGRGLHHLVSFALG